MAKFGLFGWVIGLALAEAPDLSAATTLHYWTGQGANGYWSNPDNWAGPAPAGGDQRLIFRQGQLRPTNTNNLPAGTTFESIWLVGPGYNIYGNRVRTDYVRAELPFGTSGTFRPDIDASSDLAVIVDHNNTHLDLAGRITLTQDNLIVSGQGAGDVTISGTITGEGNLIKSNNGDLRLAGFGSNSYTGSTTVNAGVLRLNRYGFAINGVPRSATAVPGPLTIGSGTGGLIGDIVALERSHQIANDAVVRVHGSGSFELGGHAETIGGLVLQGGTVITGRSQLGLNGDIESWPAGKMSQIIGLLHLGTTTRRNIDVAANATLRIGASVAGASTVTLEKTGGGELMLAGNNSYEGYTVIDGGTLRVAAEEALGSPGRGTFLEGGTLILDNATVFNESLGIPFPANLAVMGTGGAWTGPVEWDVTVGVQTPANASLVLSGPVSGTGGFRKYGPGLLRLAGPDANSFTGPSTVHGGELELYKFFNGQNVLSIPGALIIGDGDVTPGTALVRHGGPGQIVDSADVILNGDGEWQLNGWPDMVGGLSGSGTVSLLQGSLTVGANDGNAAFGGVIAGDGTVGKTGMGTFTLTGVHSYSGNTTVEEGRLVVQGGLMNSPTVEVLSGAELAGEGFVQGVLVQPGGTVSPGTGPGILTAQAGVAFGGGQMQIEMNGPVAGSGHDRLDVEGELELTGATLDASLNFTPSTGASFIIMHKIGAGPVNGTFEGLPEGATLQVGGTIFQVTYTGGDGNDVALIAQGSVPGPLPSIGKNEKGMMMLQGGGQPGQELVVLAASALEEPVTWEAVAEIVVGEDGSYAFVDEDSVEHAQRFYRVTEK